MSVNNETPKEAPAEEIVFPTADEMKARIETETAAAKKAAAEIQVVSKQVIDAVNELAAEAEIKGDFTK